MEIINTNFHHLFILKPNIFKDARGQFIKQFSDEIFKINNLDSNFEESLYSISKKAVLRGMHFQTPPKEHTKIVFVSSGKILDVVVDLRKDSPTFRQHFSIILDSTNNTCLYIPKGFAHGFLSLEDNSKVHYMQTSGYDKENDYGILYDSFGFEWKKEAKKYNISDFIISNRDLGFLSMDDFLSNSKISKFYMNSLESILITGATGFIGTNLINAISKRYKITAIVRRDSNIEKIKDKCEIYRYDDINNLIAFLKNKKYIGVLHLATLYIKNHNCNDVKNIIDSNITFGSELCEALSLVDFKGWFVNVGTFWQFYKNMTDNPLDIYAASKSAFNKIIDFYVSTTNITFSTLYLNDTYGPNDTRNKIFNLWLEIANSGKTLEMSAGEQLIDLVYIDDVVRAFEILINLLNSPYASLAKNKKFALHTKNRKTLKELASIFEKVTNKKLNILWGAKPYMKRENFIPFEGGDALPYWKEEIDFEEGVKRLMGGGRSKQQISNQKYLGFYKSQKSPKYNNLQTSNLNNPHKHFTLGFVA